MGAGLSQVINPVGFLTLLVLGAAGVCLALPRRGMTPQVLGALLAGLAGGLLLLMMGLKAGPANLPNVYFYIFAALGLGAALRVITHPKPVYSALYFILSVLATAGLFLLLSAEFMAFALVIVYAGAILITYLFVIMLATQAPEEGMEDVSATYDTQAREPIAASVAGFVLLGALTAMVFRGVQQLPAPAPVYPDALLLDMPKKVERLLTQNDLMAEGETVASVDPVAGVITLNSGNTTRDIPRSEWPDGLAVTNAEQLGFNFLRDHPGAIEIAGVILLMAMLGAVVLSRKQVQMDEDAKRAHTTRLAQASASPHPVADSPLEMTQQSQHPVSDGPGAAGGTLGGQAGGRA